jgi:hypothetical protein
MKPDDIAKCIPDEVAKAGGQLLHATDDLFNLVTWDELDDHDRNSYCNHARDVIALGLAAWPGLLHDPGFFYDEAENALILPLQEAPDGK